MDGWMDGWMEGCMHVYLNRHTSSSTKVQQLSSIPVRNTSRDPIVIPEGSLFYFGPSIFLPET